MSVSRKTIHLISVFSVILVCHLNQAGVCANPIPTISARTDASACNKDNAEKEIQDFLSIESSSPPKGDTFYIQGWRWHTLSLIRDSDRLQKFANSLIQKGGQQNKSQEKLQSLNQAVDHVIDFNLKGLQRIENDIFFPWLRQKLINEDAVGADAKKAFRNVIDGVDCDRKRIDEIASKIRSEVKALDNHDSNSITSEMERTFQNLAKLSNSLSEIATSVMEREDRLLVPAVVKVVPPREQKSFNNKVLRNLGIFESRCHLVGMHDAVYDSSYGNKEEQSMFVEQIPSIARMMIERWRTSLYEPKAGMLGEL
jgi:hypothetical protein